MVPQRNSDFPSHSVDFLSGLAFPLNKRMIHSRKHSTLGGSASDPTGSEVELSEQGWVSIPLATGAHAAAVRSRGCHFARFVYCQEVGDAVVEGIAIFVIVLQRASEVTLMHFTQELGHFQLLLNLFQI